MNISELLPVFNKMNIIANPPMHKFVRGGGKCLNSDKFEVSSEIITEVDYNSFLLKYVQEHEKIVSRKFGGCKGFGILQNNIIFFSHYPFIGDKFKQVILSSLDIFKSNCPTKIITISPTCDMGNIFSEYINLVKNKVGNNIIIQELHYPRKPGTHSFVGIIENGDIKAKMVKD